ncbi:MAG: helix-turn-helix domain-containing protein [Oscillospiraceae bacterium]|nr:helix-turn-helix domain-containing protein [Oscillospiraceae bacterium]
MISYEPFWKTLKEKSLTSYALTKKMNVKDATLYRMRKGRPMTTTTLDELCRILDCEVQDIVCYLPDKKGK